MVGDMSHIDRKLLHSARAVVRLVVTFRAIHK